MRSPGWLPPILHCVPVEPPVVMTYTDCGHASPRRDSGADVILLGLCIRLPAACLSRFRQIREAQACGAGAPTSITLVNPV